jgi:AAA family ATP:ADP antiporter
LSYVAIMPCISLVSYNVLAFIPVMTIMMAAKVAENSTDYSLNHTVRNMLFLPCSREEKYSAKQVIDSFFVRLADVMAVVMVFIGTTYLGLSARGFAVVNVIWVLVWLALAISVRRKYRALTMAQSLATGGSA